MATVHFVYNLGLQLEAPERITDEIAARLRRRYAVETYDQREHGTIRPAAGDVLLGHPARYGAPTLFNRAFQESGWAKRIVFCPFSHGLPQDAATIDGLVDQADHYLALCGPYWFDTVGDSLLSHWAYKMMRCDLGVNRGHYPVVKFDFNPPGRRRFLYIGNASPIKGVDYFCQLADANRDLGFGWIGWVGERHRPAGTLRRDHQRLESGLRSGRVTVHGGANWREHRDLGIAASYDFLLTCGRSDSNPAPILEAAAWGLVPVAPLQCGYYGDDWLVNLPLDDVAGASQILRYLNECPEEELVARREAGFRRLDTHYTWDHAARQVLDCIEAAVPTQPADRAWLARKRDNQQQLAALVQRYHEERDVEDRLEAARQLPRRVMTGIQRALGLRR